MSPTHNVNADKRDEHLLALQIGVGHGHANNSNNELANRHAQSTDQEE